MRKPPGLVVLAGALTTIAIIAQMAALSWVIAHVFPHRETLGMVFPALLALLAAGVIRALLTGVREYAAREAATRTERTLRTRLFEHLLRLGPAFTRNERTGELITLAVSGLERVGVYVSRYLPQITLSVVSPLLIAAAILPFDTLSAVLLLLTAPVIPALMIFAGSYAKEHIDAQWLALTRMSAHFLDAVQGMTTLVLFGRAQAETERVGRISERFRERSLKALRAAFISGFLLEFMTAVAIGIIAVELGVRLLNGAIPFERALFILLLAPEFYRPLRELGIQRHAGMEGKTALARYEDVMRTPVPVRAPVLAVEPPVTPLEVTLSNVTYTYPDAREPALRGVSLTLEPGMLTALVGPSGAGKSTLAQLLLRFLDPASGEIYVNGLPLSDLSPDVWRRFVAVVPQRPYLFAGTVRENLLLARPEATDKAIRAAAHEAGADDFIETLPLGYETRLGERGARLSAGQAQRIAIARAFLKDAPLLIMDEPTSHLDPESETAIREATERLTRNRTALIIAHRISTVATAERIAVLDSGQIVESGTHAALCAHGGAYARLTNGHGRVEVAL